jgi:hypothetical protein
MEKIYKYSDLIAKLKSNQPYFRISYRGLHDETSMELDFDYCCKAVWAMQNLHYGVEEIGHHSNSWKMPNSLQTIISAGRHKGISFYCTSQRASNCHPLIRALATRIVTFKQTEPRDIEWLSEVMGDKAIEATKLEKYKSIEWSDDDSSHNTDLDTNAPQE